MHKLLIICLLIFPLHSFCQQFYMIELEEKKIPEPKALDSIVDQWNRSQPGFQSLPTEAKQLLYWTNYARRSPEKFWDSAVVPALKLFKVLNTHESASLQKDLFSIGSLPMFTLNLNLVNTAQLHASDIGIKKAQPSHTSTNGTDFSTRMKLAGIKYCANENISLSSQSVLLSVILLYLDIGLPQMGHRKTLLDPNLKETGVGSCLYGEDGFFLVQDFACLQQ